VRTPLALQQVEPSLADLSGPIPVVDFKAWICAARVLDGTELGQRIGADLSGPLRTLSSETRVRYATWELEWRAKTHASEVIKVLGFLPDSRAAQ
jgi:hypothetical protein